VSAAAFSFTTPMSTRETVLPPGAAETDKTGETDIVSVSNGAFLLAVFADELADARPVVVSFDGDPASAPARVWMGRPWDGVRRQRKLTPWRHGELTPS
jgi:hypothetical protein